MKDSHEMKISHVKILVILLSISIGLGCQKSESGKKSLFPEGRVIANIASAEGEARPEERNEVLVSDKTAGESVHWFSIPLAQAQRLRIGNPQFVVEYYTSDSQSCQPKDIKIEFRWVTFNSNGHVETEYETDSYNHDIIYVDPAKTGRLKVSLKGEFQKCQKISASFVIRAINPEDVDLQIKEGLYANPKVGKNFGSAIALTGKHPILKASFESGETAELICYYLHCAGVSSNNRKWLIGLEMNSIDVSILGGTQSGDLIRADYAFTRGLEQREIDFTLPLTKILSGRWAGEVAVFDGSTQVATELLDLENEIKPTGPSKANFISFKFSFMGKPKVLENLSVTVEPDGNVTRECKGKKVNVGTYNGGPKLEILLTDADCQTESKRTLTFEKTSDGKIALQAFSGSRTYKSIVTPW
jgi:hypothetical protein